MKLASLFIVFFSLSSFAQPREIFLKSFEKLALFCPEGLELTSNQIKNEYSCSCPKDSIATKEGDRLFCNNLCEIEVKTVEEWDEDCNQGGGCSRTLEYRYEVVTVRNKTLNKSLFYEVVINLNYEILLKEAKDVAQSNEACSKTFYLGSEI